MPEKTKDLYSEVARRTGVGRNIVKALCFVYMYNSAQPVPEAKLEDLLVKHVNAVRGFAENLKPP